MARRTGSADLPLHNGRVPAWLASRMATLGAIVTAAHRGGGVGRYLVAARDLNLLAPAKP